MLKGCKTQIQPTKVSLFIFSRFRKTFQVLHLLSQEEATWKLVRNLFYDRLEGSLKNEMLMDVDSSEDRHIVMGIQRDQEIADNLVKRDKTLRECQVEVYPIVSILKILRIGTPEISVFIILKFEEWLYSRATEIFKSKSVCSTDDVIGVIGTCVQQSQIVTKTNDSSFSSKSVSEIDYFSNTLLALNWPEAYMGGEKGQNVFFKV